jgi:hypothetical protein
VNAAVKRERKTFRTPAELKDERERERDGTSRVFYKLHIFHVRRITGIPALPRSEIYICTRRQ